MLPACIQSFSIQLHMLLYLKKNPVHALLQFVIAFQAY